MSRRTYVVYDNGNHKGIRKLWVFTNKKAAQAHHDELVTDPYCNPSIAGPFSSGEQVFGFGVVDGRVIDSGLMREYAHNRARHAAKRAQSDRK